MLRIGFLASGNLGYKVLCTTTLIAKISVVLTDKHSTDIINFCLSKNVPYYAGNPREGKVLHLINDVKIDILLSVNYLFLIEKEIINWPKKYAINFHGSLLPKYRGRTPHVWAIINNEKETGITAHLIDEGCDSGAIIDQIKIEIENNDTGASILEKYTSLYPSFVKKILEYVFNEKIITKEQDHSKATYFSKRTPDDGQINWQWQKERIHNWVRAQANPYPGAFCFYDGYKIIINKIIFSDLGFKDCTPNGCIVKIENGLPVVKTQNGAIKIMDKIQSQKINYQEGNLFV